MTSVSPTTHKVTTSEGTLELPTYLLTGQNRNPVFRSQYGVAHIYPYTLLDEIDSKPTLKTYHTLVLENRYLRLTVLPELGGRVYSLFDKISGREVFYKNKVVKFSPLAIRGAFFSGGLEFSFPVAHAPTTADSVNWDMRENPDGSASISFGGQEHMNGLRWTITLTLFPERCVLAQDVRLYNPTPLPGRYHYWTNASLDADDGTEFIYPLQRARSYEFAGTASWPFARLDLIQKEPGLPGMEGVPMWPAARLMQPVNFRWQKNMLAQVSIFGRDVDWDFFGAWQHTTNQGYAHCARAHDVAGMKLWSWGNAAVGVVNQTALTDDGSVYAETQCGAMETQLDFDLLMPGKTRAWREWWMPMRAIGGLSCANTEAGARIHILPGETPDEVSVTLGVCPSRDLGKATVRLSTPERVLIEATAEMAPENPWSVTRQLPSKDVAGAPLSISVYDAEQGEVLAYTFDRGVNLEDPKAPETTETIEPSEAYYRQGLKYENFDNRAQALIAYQNAFKAKPQHGPAHLRLGLMRLRSAHLREAKIHFQAATRSGLSDASYYLGLIAIHKGDLHKAEEAFKAVSEDSPLAATALIGLGNVAMQHKDWSKALQAYRRACQMDNNSLAATRVALALRKSGETQAAVAHFQEILSHDPLNLVALRELASLPGESSAEAAERLNARLKDDRQYHLDLAVSYLQAGLPEEALAVLDEAAGAWPYPMVHYLAGSILQSLGNPQKARQRYSQGEAASPEFGFPSRLEEAQALEKALRANPKDTKACYLLGNFLYARERWDEAIALWERALQGLPDYDVLHRNLGLAAWQQGKDTGAAMAYFEHALELNPMNQDVILHLDDLYKAEGLTEKREALLARIQAMPAQREDVRKRALTLLVDLGRYEEALERLTGETFVPLEMDQSFHQTYVRALLGRGEAQEQKGEIEAAIAGYRRALEFPANIGVGQPTTLAQAGIYFKLGCAYERLGCFKDALAAWQAAASEHHPYGSELYPYIQASLDKLSRYSELGFGL